MITPIPLSQVLLGSPFPKCQFQTPHENEHLLHGQEPTPDTLLTQPRCHEQQESDPIVFDLNLATKGAESESESVDQLYH
jgi:hypothetical protein